MRQRLEPASIVSDGSTVSLADGRQLAYAEFGDGNGEPMVVLHGTPGSRVTSAVLHGAATAAGVRIVAVDRPGYGGSDPVAGLTFGSYADDLLQLLDTLRLDRVTVAAISGGGGFGMGCAHRLPDRLHRLVLASAMLPVPGSICRQLPASQRLAFVAAARAPWLLTAVLRRLAAREPDAAAARLPAADRRVLADPALRQLLVADTHAEALRQGYGAIVRDMTLYTRADPALCSAPDVPVTVLHGRDDGSVPLPIANWVAERLGADLQVLDDAGHLAIAEYPHALCALAGR